MFVAAWWLSVGLGVCSLRWTRALKLVRPGLNANAVTFELCFKKTVDGNHKKKSGVPLKNVMCVCSVGWKGPRPG